MLFLDMLGDGHPTESNAPSLQPCEHERPSSTSDSQQFYVLGANLKHSPPDYFQRIAALRFESYETQPRVNDSDVVYTYLEPVVAICNKYLLKQPSARFTYETELIEDQQLTRVYLQDTDRKRLHLMFYCAPKGKICWAGFQSEPLDKYYITCNKITELLEKHHDEFFEERPQFIAVTDMDRILILTGITIYDYYRRTSLDTYALAPGRQSLRHALCLLLCQAEECDLNTNAWPKFLQGALNDSDPDLELPSKQQYRAFRDFDRFTLQRSIPYLNHFLGWKNKESERLGTPFVVPGTVLDVDVDAFIRDESLWRSLFPNPAVPPSTKEFVGRNPRQRLHDVDQILSLAAEQHIQFQVTDVIRHKPDTYSQVFFGILSTNGSVSARICLKVFLDVLFPIDAAMLAEDFKEEAMLRLSSLQYPENIVRREEAAYARLTEHQGTMIPHCYGFHRFTLPGKFTAYGALLEIIPGPTLAQIDTSTWSDCAAAKRGFAQHARECLRTLSYAGIDQADFHCGQIILPDGPDYRPGRDSVVFIDFGFAYPRLGDEQRPGIASSMLTNSESRLTLQYDIVGKHCEISRAVYRPLFRQETFHWNEW
ncbi:hypothetical protein MIND_00957300 [Mycena indigotica]|uniref:Uncharacterized protein n=1 Tax=Mycena indigotica TaxID=2126181 RepID=A0A8H6VX97_9AGAR|nr:uncharacterized protein MIND_00957300 [Mycena indigotica]KAF7297242.1 hypothetical protein MIND_00957300 [Mycena indigotica]